MGEGPGLLLNSPLALLVQQQPARAQRAALLLLLLVQLMRQQMQQQPCGLCRAVKQHLQRWMLLSGVPLLGPLLPILQPVPAALQVLLLLQVQ